MFRTKETEMTPEILHDYFSKNDFSQDDLESLSWTGFDEQGILAHFERSDYQSFDNFMVCLYPQIYVDIFDI